MFEADQVVALGQSLPISELLPAAENDPSKSRNILLDIPGCPPLPVILSTRPFLIHGLLVTNGRLLTAESSHEDLEKGIVSTIRSSSTEESDGNSLYHSSLHPMGNIQSPSQVGYRFNEAYRDYFDTLKRIVSTVQFPTASGVATILGKIDTKLLMVEGKLSFVYPTENHPYGDSTMIYSRYIYEELVLGVPSKKILRDIDNILDFNSYLFFNTTDYPSDLPVNVRGQLVLSTDAASQAQISFEKIDPRPMENEVQTKVA